MRISDWSSDVCSSDLCDAIHVSSGGLHPAQEVPVGPSYQVPLARAVKSAVGMPVIAVGLITGFEQAEAIVATGDADMIALARTILYDPRWPWHAAAELGGQDRKSVGEGKSVSVRVDLGLRRILKKKKNTDEKRNIEK